MEKEAIGFYVSGHPLHQYDKELQRYARPAASVQRARRDDKVTVAGIVSQLRERPTKTGKRMAWVTLEDLSGSVELVCFPGKEGGRSMMGKDGKWTKGRPTARVRRTGSRCSSRDEPILVTGTVQVNSRDEENPIAELIVEQVQSLQGGPRQAGEAARAARPGGPGHRGSPPAARPGWRRSTPGRRRSRSPSCCRVRPRRSSATPG